LESTHGTPYYLNLHSGDVAHTLMLGATGSGKSFAASTILQSAQKYDPFTFIFDLGGSLNFLYLFLRVLIEAGGRFELTTADEKALYATLERIYKAGEITEVRTAGTDRSERCARLRDDCPHVSTQREQAGSERLTSKATASPCRQPREPRPRTPARSCSRLV
jgi:hypothetical protein